MAIRQASWMGSLLLSGAVAASAAAAAGRELRRLAALAADLLAGLPARQWGQGSVRRVVLE